MVSSSLTTILALSTLSLAVPHSGKHFSFHYPQGSGFARPSGARPTGGSPFNGTEGGPFGNGTEAGFSASESLPVLTATVLPVPEDSPVADATKPADGGAADFTSPPDVNQGNAVATPAAGAPAPGAPAPAAGGEGGQCGTVTTTSTSIQYVTVTAGAEGEGASKPADSVPENFQVPSSSADIVSAAPSVSAGAFFGVPPGGNTYGGGYGQPSEAAPSTAATSYGVEPSTPASSASGTTPSTPSTPPSSGGGGGKKGLAYNSAPLLSAFDGTGMSWAYNWAPTPGGSVPAGVEFVPMCWSGKDGPNFASNAAGASHVLSFNEPDHPDQANMDPATAAADHIKYLNPLSESGAQVGSPAITNGGGSMGISWLTEWFKACAGNCKVDFVAMHCKSTHL